MNLNVNGNSLRPPGMNRSSLIVCQRSTSTPKDPSRLSLLRLEPSLDDTPRKKVNFLPNVDDDGNPEPIFGNYWIRQSLSDREKRLENGDTACRCPGISTNDEDFKTCTINFKWDAPQNTPGRRSSRRSSIYSKPKSNKQGAPILTILPRGVPRHAAMRAKLRQERRERSREESGKKVSLAQQQQQQKISNAGKRRRSTTIPMTRRQLKEREARKRVNNDNNNNNNKRKEEVNWQPFKANPIRKYAPLPSIKARSITIPQSPRLGKRRFQDAASR